MKTMKIDDSDLKEILINPKLNRRGQYICDCPFCGKEGHFYLNPSKNKKGLYQQWDCKKCGEFGSIYKLLKHFDKTYLLEGATIEIRESISSIRNSVNSDLQDSDDNLKELPSISMPVGWKVSLASTSYLLNRGVTSKDCKRYKIGATNLYKKFKNYVIIPIYDSGEIKGYVGRYGAKKVPKEVLRYNNSVGTQFSELLFGYDEITSNTITVILVEGIFDKIAVDKFLCLWDEEEIKCVCTFGKKISSSQSKKLMIKGVKNVILLYDFDAIKDIKKYGLELENDFITSITYTTKKDIDECTRDEAFEVFTSLMRPREFNVDVIGKIKK